MHLFLHRCCFGQLSSVLFELGSDQVAVDNRKFRSQLLSRLEVPGHFTGVHRLEVHSEVACRLHLQAVIANLLKVPVETRMVSEGRWKSFVAEAGSS